MKISMSGATFIPVTKSNLARKHLKFSTDRRKPLNLGVFSSTSNELRRPQNCLGFVPDLKGSLKVVEMDVVSFRFR